MSTLKVNSIIPVAGVPTGGGGGIIQVVQAEKDDTASTSNTGYTDIGLSVTITPSSASSKILIFADLTIGGGNLYMVGINLVRGSTAITQSDYSNRSGSSRVWSPYDDSAGANKYNVFSVPLIFLDSPSTTSATTYKIQTSTYNSSHTIYINRAKTEDGNALRASSTLTAMEVTT